MSEKKPTTPLNQLAAEIHQNAVEHGWWEKERELPEILMLCVSELSEALEEYRENRVDTWKECITEQECCTVVDLVNCHFSYYDRGECKCDYRGEKPEGVYVEMIDCMIRILDYLGHAGVDVDSMILEKMEYNKTRPYRHGGKVC